MRSGPAAAEGENDADATSKFRAPEQVRHPSIGMTVMSHEFPYLAVVKVRCQSAVVKCLGAVGIESPSCALSVLFLRSTATAFSPRKSLAVALSTERLYDGIPGSSIRRRPGVLWTLLQSLCAARPLASPRAQRDRRQRPRQRYEPFLPPGVSRPPFFHLASDPHCRDIAVHANCYVPLFSSLSSSGLSSSGHVSCCR